MLTVVQPPTQASAVEVSRAALVALLDRAKHVVPTRFPKPILTCVHLEASQSWLHLRATDGDMALFTQMPIESELPACVVPFAELSRRHVRPDASFPLNCNLFRRQSESLGQLLFYFFFFN